MKPRQWFAFRNSAADPTVAEIHIIDIIGDWIDELINEYWGMKATLTAKAFVDQLSKLDASVTTIRVHINSPGGDVFAALNITNALRDQQTSKGRTVETVIDGLAASAASVIAMAGQTVRMADNALLMVHNPWSRAVGNAADMRKAADTLDTVRDTLVATYRWHATLSDDDIIALLDAETWLSAPEALAAGFITEVVEGLQAAASIDRRAAALLKVPEQYQARVDALLKLDTEAVEPTPAPAAEVLAAVQAAGLDLAFASELVAAALPMDQIAARVDAANSTRAATQQRAAAIRAACSVAKMANLADGYIAGGMSVDQVKAHLTLIRANQDQVEIDGSIDPNHPHRAGKARIDVSAVYAARNRMLAPKE
jgi:ATP-dependent protease ClpP protease subunit